jgi:hypothetical protein
MVGFELKYNDQTITASIEDGVTTICLSKTKDSHIQLNFSGLNNPISQHITWVGTDLQKGDEIKIKVMDVTKVTDIIKSEPVSHNSLQDKLIEYQGMKKYLEKEGLI